MNAVKAMVARREGNHERQARIRLVIVGKRDDAQAQLEAAAAEEQLREVNR